MQVTISDIVIHLTLDRKVNNGIFISAGAFTLKTKNKTYYFDCDESSWSICNGNRAEIELCEIVDPNTDEVAYFEEDDLQNIIEFEDFYIYFEHNSDLRVIAINAFEITYYNATQDKYTSIEINKNILNKCLNEALAYEVVDDSHSINYMHSQEKENIEKYEKCKY